MKRLVAIGFLCAAVSAGLVADAPRISRFAMSQLEEQIDKLFAKGADLQIEGNTRGVYLDGYGAVFTTMLSVPTKMPSPFNDFSRKDVQDVHEVKLRELPAIREKIRQSLLLMAASPALDSVPPNEQIVCGVTFFYYYKWEDTHGLPREIMMQAEKQQLLSVQSGRAPKSQLESLLKVQEQ